MRFWKFWILLVLVHALLGMSPARADDWQRLAEQIPYVNYGDFLYDRPPRNLADVDSPRLTAIRSAMAIQADLPELKKRTEHEDPKIRTLALMKLYVSGDPNAFRVIHSRLNDEGVAFPAVPHFSSFAQFDFEAKALKPVQIATEEKKVGQIARMMMDMIGYPQNEDFDVWAKHRLDNPDWMGWYEFLLKRVTRGTSPTPEGIDAELAVFEKLLDARPRALRAWLGFVVADEAMIVPKEDTVLGTEKQLIEKGKALGPDALLGFLRSGSRDGLKHPNVDDPKKGIRFVLRHARHFFRKQDAEVLREMGHYIAAAELRPDMASLWIREACAKWSETYQGWDRARAMAALLDLRPGEELKFVVDWFYDAEPVSTGSTDQTVFITEYRRRRPVDWKASMTALAAHPGFDAMESMALIYCAIMINDLSGQILIDNKLLHDEHETELRNAIRRCLGLAEKSVRWINLSDQGERLDPTWSVPFDGLATRMVMSPDGSLLAILMRDGKLRIHRSPGGALLGEIPTDKAGVATIDFRRSDGRLMVVRVTGATQFWDAGQLRLVEEVEIKDFEVTEVCLDLGGVWLASRRANNVGVSVYDLQTGKRRWNVPMGIRAFGMIGASPDGSRFAVCDDFVRTVLLFDPASAEPVARLNGHSGLPKHVAFSTDGETMVTSGEDTKLMMWYAKTGQHIAEFACRQQFPRVQACSGDSTSFFFGGGAGKITRVDMTEGRVIQSLKFDGTWLQAMARSNKIVVAVVDTANGKSALVGWRLKDE